MPKGSERRDMADIPPEEIVNAICEIVKNQFALSATDLVREVGKVFGFTRLGNNMKTVISECVTIAVKAGLIKADGERISVL